MIGLYLGVHKLVDMENHVEESKDAVSEALLAGKKVMFRGSFEVDGEVIDRIEQEMGTDEQQLDLPTKNLLTNLRWWFGFLGLPMERFGN